MARRKKDFTARAAGAGEDAAAASWSRAVRALANGLFGTKKKYLPTQQEIADYYLTPREREVAYLAALGFTDIEIADALGMTFQTARAHLRSILQKMTLDDPRDLCEYFLRRAAEEEHEE